MEIKNLFFKKNKSLSLNYICKNLNIANKYKNIKINDIKDLNNANSNDLSFLNSSKYFPLINKSKAKFIIVHSKHEKILKDIYNPIVVDNVLKSVALVTNLFYPDALYDAVDLSVKELLKNHKNILFGKNVLLGNKVKNRRKFTNSHNTIISSMYN